MKWNRTERNGIKWMNAKKNRPQDNIIKCVSYIWICVFCHFHYNYEIVLTASVRASNMDINCTNYTVWNCFFNSFAADTFTFIFTFPTHIHTQNSIFESMRDDADTHTHTLMSLKLCYVMCLCECGCFCCVCIFISAAQPFNSALVVATNKLFVRV